MPTTSQHNNLPKKEVTPLQEVEVTFGETVEAPAEDKSATDNSVRILPKYKPDRVAQSAALCTVLHGYGNVGPTDTYYIDDYKFVGGVGRNIPRNIAEAWADGRRWQDNKPAASRVYIQAILPNDANEVDFAKATGVNPMPPSQLAAMIGATNAADLVKALGRKQAAELAEALLSNMNK